MSARNEADHDEVADALIDPPADFNAQIASLKQAGADRFDPVGLHHIEVLAQRAIAQPEGVKRILEAKALQMLAALRERFDQAQLDARTSIDQCAQQHPQAVNDLQRLFAAGDFKGLHRHIKTLKAAEQDASLSALVRQLEQHVPDHVEIHWEKRAGSPSELKTLRNFRNTWSKLSVDSQVAKALEQAPKNAGPINSHMLALRSLALMRDISPDYLNRFISYADALLCLDQGEKEAPVAPKKPRATKTVKK